MNAKARIAFEEECPTCKDAGQSPVSCPTCYGRRTLRHRVTVAELLALLREEAGKEPVAAALNLLPTAIKPDVARAERVAHAFDVEA